MLKVGDVMVKKVVTVSSDQTVRQAAQKMTKFGIGCLVVMRDDVAAGILTESDLLERALAAAVNPETTLVGQVMSSPVVTVDPEVSLEDAVELMFKHKIKKLPVVEQGNDGEMLVGLVTLTDIARLYPALIKTLKKFFEMIGEDPPRHLEKVMNFYIV